MRLRRLALALLAAVVAVPAAVSAAAGAEAAADPSRVGALTAEGALGEALDEHGVPAGVSTQAPSEEPATIPDPAPWDDDRGDGQPVPTEVPNAPPVEPPPATDGTDAGQDLPAPAADTAEPPSATPTPAEPPSPVEVPAEPPTADPGAWVGPAPEGEPTEEPTPMDEGAAPSTSTGEATPLDDAGSLAGEMLTVSVTTDLGLGEVPVGTSTEDVPFSMGVTNVSGAGWQVTVDGTDLVHVEDPTRAIPRTAIFLVGGSGDGPLATEVTPYAGFLPEDGALLLVDGTAAASGQFVLVDGPTLRLDVPADAVPGTYRTTLTYTIMSQP